MSKNKYTSKEIQSPVRQNVKIRSTNSEYVKLC